MSSGLTHSGAIARGLGYAPSPRAPAQAVQQPSVAVAPVPLAEPLARLQAQARDEVAAERGINLLSRIALSPQDRVRSELQIWIEATERALTAQAQERAHVRATGTLLDLRV